VTARDPLLKWWSAAFVLVAAIALQWIHAGSIPQDLQSLGIRRVLVLTAHPDDEVMFFAPAILHLLAAGAQVYGLCMSSGNAAGLGEIRKGEIIRAYQTLGVPPAQVSVVDDPILPDSMTKPWNYAYIGTKVASAIYANDIDTVITFDHAGVSSHPNHVALHKTVSDYLMRGLGREYHTWLSEGKLGQGGGPIIPVAYALHTPSLAIKYLGLPMALFEHIHAMRSAESVDAEKQADPRPQKLVFLSSPAQSIRTLQAMRSHASQLVWFRYLYALFSMLMYGSQLDRIVMH